MRHIFDHTIGPNEPAPVSKKRRSQYVVIDSSLRNKTLYPSPSKYSVNLDENYKYITSVELVSSCVPTIDLVKIVSGTNDTLVVDGTPVTIAAGEYTGEELADSLELAINATSLSGFIVNFNESSNKLEFENDTGAYTLDIAGNMADTLGLKRLVPSALSAPYGATTQYKLEIQNCPYVMLRIGQLEHFRTTSSNAGIRDAFALINIKRRFAEETVMLENTNIKHFNPVLPRLSKLNIEFVRPDNTLHDFRNRDHVLIFKITTMNGSGAFD